jgi:hypothetical protein
MIFFSAFLVCPLNPPKGDLHGVDFIIEIFFPTSPPSGDLGGFDE